MQKSVLVMSILFQVAAVGWAVCFYLKFVRPSMRMWGATWRDALMGLGLFLNIGALAVIPWLFGVRLHPVILITLGVLALHAWMKFWVKLPHRSVGR